MPAAGSTPAARRKLSCDPAAAAGLIVTFTRGLAVMERAFHDPRQLEAQSQARPFGHFAVADDQHPSRAEVSREGVEHLADRLEDDAQLHRHPALEACRSLAFAVARSHFAVQFDVLNLRTDHR